MGEDFDNMETDELLETLSVQNFYMQESLEYTHSLLMQMGTHFHTIADSMNE